jgi:predicted amidohydrolase
MAFPEAWRGMIAAGAKIIIAPTFWTLDSAPNGMKRNPQSEAIYLNSLVVSRAFENTCAVVFVNAGGPAQKFYAGLSQIGMPFMGALGKIETSEETMNVVDVDMEILEEAEDDYKIRTDLGNKNWHYTLCGATEGKKSKL